MLESTFEPQVFPGVLLPLKCVLLPFYRFQSKLKPAQEKGITG